MEDYAWISSGEQVPARVAWAVGDRLEIFVLPLLVALDEVIDKRLVRTFVKGLQALMELRNRAQGLLLSELGAYVCSPGHAAAGTKRLSNLLRSPRWTHHMIERFLWEGAGYRLAELSHAGRDVLVAWDESVLEKAESSALEGLSSVRSSKAARLKRIKPGYFNPPGGPPIMVPGMHWVTLLLMGFHGAPVVAAMRWWSTRGRLASDRRTEETELLRQCAARWGRCVLHIWDRGFAGAHWLAQASRYRARFVLRWPKGYKLWDDQGRSRKAWEITRGKRSSSHRDLWDARRHCWRKTGLVRMPTLHPDYNDPLWLIVSRPGHGRTPWYLLTNEPIHSDEDAWRIILAYARRWQVETAHRFGKSELAMESPRLWSWENRLKLLLMVTLLYSFLLSLLQPQLEALRHWLLQYWCHRTGKRSRDTPSPLYRLRSALSRLWLSYPPPSLSCI